MYENINILILIMSINLIFLIKRNKKHYQILNNFMNNLSFKPLTDFLENNSENYSIFVDNTFVFLM
jgi:hypothetical protein